MIDRRTRTLVALLALATLPLAACEYEPEGDTELEEMGDTVQAAVDTAAAAEEIRRRGERLGEAVAARDIDWISELYTRGASLVSPGELIIQGRDTIRSVWSGYLAAPRLELNLDPERIVFGDAGDVAWDVGKYTATYEDPERGLVEDRGNYLIVWSRADGEWEIAAKTFASRIHGGEGLLPMLEDGSEGETVAGADGPS